MSALRDMAEDYLRMRRALGYKLEIQGLLLAANYQTLIGLLSVTGLRLSEAIRLDRVDVDDRHQLLRILDSKFGKSREVVLHETTMRLHRPPSVPRGLAWIALAVGPVPESWTPYLLPAA